MLPPALRSLAPAASRASSLRSAAVWLGLGLQLPLVPASLPGTRSNPGQQGPDPVERFCLTNDSFLPFAAVGLILRLSVLPGAVFFAGEVEGFTLLLRLADVFLADVFFAGELFFAAVFAGDSFAADLFALDCLLADFFAVAMLCLEALFAAAVYSLLKNLLPFAAFLNAGANEWGPWLLKDPRCFRLA